MDRSGIPQSPRGDRKGKRPGRRARGVWPVERDGYWHAHGTLRTGGRSIRIRRSLGLSVKTTSEDEACTELEAYLSDVKAQATGQTRRGDAVAIAARAYLMRSRERKLAPSAISIIKEITTKFGTRRLNEIPPGEWNAWIDGDPNTGSAGRHTGNSAATRERFLNGMFAFLNFCHRHHGMSKLPVFERDKKARNPNRRARRRVEDLRPDLISLLFQSAHIALRAQLAVEWCTGARVSSVLYGVRVCDLILAKGREQIIFRGTKNGEDVLSALNPTTVAVLKEYLDWRGCLHEREEPLFLTPRKLPYVFNNRAGGGQNKTAFNAAKRRAQKAVLDRAANDASHLRKAGRRKEEEAVRDRADSDAALLGKVTQHWFRHLLATKLLRSDPRATMEQGGWLDIRSVIGYAQDMPEHRRKLVQALDDLPPVAAGDKAKA